MTSCRSSDFSQVVYYNCPVGHYVRTPCTGTISGKLFDATNDTCQTKGGAPKIGNGIVIATATQYPPPISYSSDPSSNVLGSKGSYSVTTRVPDTFEFSFDMSSADPAYMNSLTCPNSATSVQFTNNGDAQSVSFGFIKAYDSWFQTIGGNVRAESTNTPAIQSHVPDSCAAPDCSPYLLRKNTAGTTNSAGFAVPGQNGATGGTVVSSASGGDLSKLSEDANSNVVAFGKRVGFKEGFDYFSNKIYSMGVQPISDFTSAQMQNLAYFDPATKTPANTGRAAYYADGDATITDTWAVPANKSIVIFVHGNLNINNTVTVANGSFLAFIVSGNITIGNTVGTGTYTSETPQVEGVYIADGAFAVASKSSGNTKVSDLKFVGAGTFVGWSGVLLQRDYKDTATPNLGIHNNDTPTELFVGRPDFALNAPPEIKKPQYTWQEVAP